MLVGTIDFFFFSECSPDSRGQKVSKPGVLGIYRSGLVIGSLLLARKRAMGSPAHCLPLRKISEHLACVGFSARRLEDEYDWA